MAGINQMNAGVWYNQDDRALIRDVDLRGGYMVVPNKAARLAIAGDSSQTSGPTGIGQLSAATGEDEDRLKLGMLVCDADTMTIWQLINIPGPVLDENWNWSYGTTEKDWKQIIRQAKFSMDGTPVGEGQSFMANPTCSGTPGIITSGAWIRFAEADLNNDHFQDLVQTISGGTPTAISPGLFNTGTFNSNQDTIGRVSVDVGDF